MSDSSESGDSKEVIVHASIYLAGAFRVDASTKKLVPISELALQSHNAVIAIGGELAAESNDALAELACQKLIKAYLDEGAKSRVVAPNLPPAEGVN